MISNSHIKNFDDLLNNEINSINRENKLLASRDIKSCYINIPVNKCIKCFENHFKNTNITSHLLINKLIKIFALCIKDCFKKYNSMFYKQKFGFSMSSSHIYIYIYIYIYICAFIYKASKVGDLSRDWLEGPFSIAITPRCKGERYSFRWITLLYSWSIPYNAEC